MEPFESLSAAAIPVVPSNVDTDQIIPARFLGLARTEQAAGLFADVRQSDDEAGSRFPIGRPGYEGARIIVAGENFGCGSSREQAVTALVDNGFRAFIAASFGDIFSNNCFQNGALPVLLPLQRVHALQKLLQASPGAQMTVDLRAQQVLGPDGQVDGFDIDTFRKDCLLRGVDEISLTFGYETEIEGFEQRQRLEQDWL